MGVRQAGRAGAWSGVDSLWPQGTCELTRRPGRAPALLVLPSRRAPRLLVPTGLPSAASMLARHSRSRRQRLGQAMLSRGVSSGLLSLLPVWRLVPHADDRGDASIQSYVRTHLPAAASVGALLGPPRANAKPVLRVFDDKGRTIAFGKVGHNEIAGALVRHEHQVLQELRGAGFVHLEPPGVLHCGTWRGLDVLLLEALASSDRAEPSWELPVSAMYELAEHAGVTSGGVAESPYLRALRDRAAALPATSPVHDHLAVVAQRSGQMQLSFGRWHGDWAPWNMGSNMGLSRGSGSSPVPLWDWERSQAAVPVGFDVVHFLLQEQFKDHAGAPTALAALRGASIAPLGRWYRDRGQVDATIQLYLCEILTRYVSDGGIDPTSSLRSRIATILTMLSLYPDITQNAAEEFHADA
jgi:hypothetical protein